MTKYLLVLFALFSGSASARTVNEVVCSYAPSQSKIVAAISGSAGGAVATINAVAAATGLTVVTHSSGAAILTGSGGYVAGTLGTASAVPYIVIATLVVGGGAVAVELVCANKNHPDQVARVKEAADEFSRRFTVAMSDIQVATGTMRKSIAPAARAAASEVQRTANDIWEYVYRASTDASASITN